jgi:predicted esterase
LLIAAGPLTTGQYTMVTFEHTTALATNDALLERFFSPLAYADHARKADKAALAAQPIALKDERFRLFVPQVEPPQGYALLVFVSPVDDVDLPAEWQRVLESRGTIFVAAQRSGNLTSPIGRRIPLALTATANVVRQYRIDPERIWIAGFSGGARIAERIALQYPDVFAGGILDGSSDPIASDELPLPSQANFDRFLEHTSLVLSTGADDTFNTDAARGTAANLRRHCFSRFSVEVRRREGHQLMDGRSLEKALDYLQRAPGAREPVNRQCRDTFVAKVEADLARVKKATEAGDGSAKGSLRALDREFGWLAAPRSMQLRADLLGGSR